MTSVSLETTTVVSLDFDQGTYNVAAGDHGEKLIVPMPSNVMHIDTQRAMAVAPNDEPRTLDTFKRAVSDSMKGTPQRMQMSAMQSKPKPQKSMVEQVVTSTAFKQVARTAAREIVSDPATR